MGLFDQFIKDGAEALIKAKEAVEKETGIDIDAKLEELIDKADVIDPNEPQKPVDMPDNAEYAGAPSFTSFTAATNNPEGTYLDVRFSEVFAEAFPQYTVKKNMRPEALGFSTEGTCNPYAYALFAGPSVRAVIQLTPHNRSNNKAYRNTMNAATRAGVAYVNFYTHFPNEKDYIISRLNSLI